MALELFSNPLEAQRKAYEYLGNDATLYKSTRKNKKYMVFDKNNNKYVHFGQIGYIDYTKSKDQKKRLNYLKRSENIKGHWKDNEYSPNNLSRNILW